MTHLSRSLEETGRIAKEILDSLDKSSSATVLALQGDLGSGKTTFSQAAGKLLGVSEEMSSPTFVIEKIYDIDFKGFKKLIHIDAYRLEKAEELLHLGWEEILKNPENLIFIEWPENVSKIIPENAVKISFKFVDEQTREISYEK